MVDDRGPRFRGGQFDSPLAAARFVKLAVYRSTGFTIEGPTESEVVQQLTTGYDTIDEGDRAAVYGEAVLTYVNNLIAELPRADGNGIEKRGGVTAPRPGSPLPPEALRSAFKSICPLWPFC